MGEETNSLIRRKVFLLECLECSTIRGLQRKSARWVSWRISHGVNFLFGIKTRSCAWYNDLSFLHTMWGFWKLSLFFTSEKVSSLRCHTLIASLSWVYTNLVNHKLPTYIYVMERLYFPSRRPFTLYSRSHSAPFQANLFHFHLYAILCLSS